MSISKNTRNISRRKFGLGAAGLLAVPAVIATTLPARAATHVVTIKGFKFSPSDLSIAAGDTVQFENGDKAPHTATATDGAFNTGTIAKGAAIALTFPSSGKFDYFCKFHPNMKATITVA